MTRDEIENISSNEITVRHYKQTLRANKAFPSRILDELNVGTGDYIYYFALSDGTVQMVSQDFIDRRLGEYYEQLLPTNFVDLD